MVRPKIVTGFFTVAVLLFALTLFAAGKNSAASCGENLFFIHQRQTEEQAMDTRGQQDSIKFELASGTVVVDENTLKKMKEAMLSFFNKPDKEFPAQYLELRDSFRKELKSSAVMISDGVARVGAWKLENQDGRLVLVWYPPPSKNTMYLFHATLERKDSGWEVVSFEHERELGPE
jgi:hypothetical protein